MDQLSYDSHNGPVNGWIIVERPQVVNVHFDPLLIDQIFNGID